MKKLVFVSKTRGFFNHLFNSNVKKWNFLNDGNSYEKTSIKKIVISKVGRSKLLDWFGYIQVLKNKDNIEADILGSYNRFIETEKPYVIYLENPTALFHYKLERENSYLGKKKIEKYINDPNLKAIVCMSNACKIGFELIYKNYIHRNDLIIEQIYPLIPETKVNINKKIFSLLFIAQGKGFISKGGIELLNVMKKFNDEKNKIKLVIVSSWKSIPTKYQQIIEHLDNVEFKEFGMPFEELKKLYIENSVLIHMTRQDSFGLTILEAIKHGMPVISTAVYSIPEVVKNDYNGFVSDPTVYFFNPNFLPNKKVWNNRKNTIFLDKPDRKIEKFLYEKIKLLSSDSELLKKMSKNSLKLSQTEPFSEKFITSKWSDLLDSILEEKS